MLNLFVNSQVSPRGAFVASAENPVPAKVPDLVLGSVREARLYIVDGAGDYDAISGDADAAVIVAIGPRANPLWANASWTPIANGWSGQIAVNTEDLAALFADADSKNPQELELAVQVTDGDGNPVAYSNQIIKVWDRLIDPDLVSTNPLNNAGDGVWNISNGVDLESVTGLGLSLVPRKVFVSVRKPSGGLTLFASVVDGSVTTAGFDFTLSGMTDQTGYKLDYLFLY